MPQINAQAAPTLSPRRDSQPLPRAVSFQDGLLSRVFQAFNPTLPVNATERNVVDQYENIRTKHRFVSPQWLRKGFWNDEYKPAPLLNSATRQIFNQEAIPEHDVAAVMQEYLTDPGVAHNFIDAGCGPRAHEIAYRLRQRGHKNVHKVFVYGETPRLGMANDVYKVHWTYHVAPLYMASNAEQARTPKVIDLSIENRWPLDLSDWINRIANPDECSSIAVQFAGAEHMQPPHETRAPTGFGDGAMAEVRARLKNFRTRFAYERNGMLSSLRPHNLSNGELIEQFSADMENLVKVPGGYKPIEQDARVREMRSLLSEATLRGLPEAGTWEEALEQAKRGRSAA